ncbi:ABC transporter ATP-binding protein [Modestobacter sp. VKM Ac-2984]|uniref:ABC transporter ATP-binding protein n=1 Tax=Modestobacter sp. VKM Ac-2984 TaxID=3004138 RepID=UPI0022AAD801|nr:ABC transporter ATP-binding protein [Modestobacter sp. VKM Ac-2984]MCZ2818347.1 ABC transporter ATP-binding protein [Modestobacter sp. VKM Ac-2984]
MSTIGTTGPAMSGATSTGAMTQGRTTSLPGFDPSAPLLEVTDLNVRFPTEDGLVHAVRGVDYSLRSGEVLGIVGESGSGKSVTSLAVMGLLPGSARVTGSIKYRGQELLGQSDRSMSRIRGKGVSMIFQDPMTSLDPVYKIGAQIEETLRIHDKQLSSKAAEARAVELLELVGIPNAGDRVDAYPHEFSGGMRQRVVIAIAMANQPEVIIADEPTTALDVTVQAQILEVLQTALQETGAAMVMITHDLGVVAGIADRVLVMYAGRPVEIGSVEDIYYEPRMPYTLGLLGSLPRLDSTSRERLTPIKGAPPSVVNMPPGCPFAPRCPLHIAECDEAEPERFQVGPGHTAACIRTEQVAAAHGRAADIFSESADDAALAADRTPAGVALAQDDLDDDGPAVPPGDQTSPRAGLGDAGTQSVVSSPPRPTNGDRA